MYDNYRAKLIELSHSVKLNYYYQLLGLNHGNMFKFMKGDNSAIKLDKLEMLIELIKNDLSKKIA